MIKPKQWTELKIYRGFGMTNGEYKIITTSSYNNTITKSWTTKLYKNGILEYTLSEKTSKKRALLDTECLIERLNRKEE